MKKSTSADRRLVELEAGTFQPIAVYRTLTEASRLRSVSRAALYDAINSGKACLDSRWMFAIDWDTRASVLHGKTVDQFLALYPSRFHSIERSPENAIGK